MDGCQPFFFFTLYPPFFHGVISHHFLHIPAAKASCCTANPHCSLIELLEIKKTKLTKSGEILRQYHCLYEAWRNSYTWLPQPGDMAVCMLEELARPWVGGCVPLAFCLCSGNGLFPSYVAPSLCFKARLSGKLLNNLKRIFFYSHANKSHFLKKGFLKVSVFGNRKWHIL